MKWVRFQAKQRQPAYGILDGSTIRQISGSMYSSYQETGECFPREELIQYGLNRQAAVWTPCRSDCIFMQSAETTMILSLPTEESRTEGS